MRKSVLLCLALAALPFGLSGAAHAYENFIPMGTGYSSEVDSLPRFESDRGQVSVTTDVLETEVWRRNREDAELDSRFRQFQSGNELDSNSDFIDY